MSCYSGLKSMSVLRAQSLPPCQPVLPEPSLLLASLWQLLLWAGAGQELSWGVGEITWAGTLAGRCVLHPAVPGVVGALQPGSLLEMQNPGPGSSTCSASRPRGPSRAQC